MTKSQVSCFLRHNVLVFCWVLMLMSDDVS